jgi:hypothetical protein
MFDNQKCKKMSCKLIDIIKSNVKNLKFVKYYNNRIMLERMREESTPSVYFNFDYSNQVSSISKFRKLTKSVWIKSTYLSNTLVLIRLSNLSINKTKYLTILNFNLQLRLRTFGNKFVRIYTMVPIKIKKVEIKEIIRQKIFKLSWEM